MNEATDIQEDYAAYEALAARVRAAIGPTDATYCPAGRSLALYGPDAAIQAVVDWAAAQPDLRRGGHTASGPGYLAAFYLYLQVPA